MPRNSAKAQADALREELSHFLATTLRLDLSKDKTTSTHLNDGCTFLGFQICRMESVPKLDLQR